MQAKTTNYYLEMKQHELEVPYYKKKRRIRVLLPKDYDKEEWAHYPVLYMHDGQNVFYSKEAFSGYSWKLIPLIKQNKDLPKMIIVGIDNAEERRLDEYAPWQTDTSRTTTYAHAGGDGMLYSDWVVNTVKPFIDAHYRTKPEREHTLLAGSSMGGLMTAYMGAAHPETFGVLGVFSLASWFSERDFLRFIRNHPLANGTDVYIQVGTKEGDATDAQFIEGCMNQAYIDCSLAYYQALLQQGHALDDIWLRILANETHHEKYWAAHFVEFLRFAFRKQLPTHLVRR
ncbi:alpha/beta hydrolase-fold protein [Aerococcaceae bacterium NML201209]|nr:alpha/beta hydrolase-fold protein [Aerococcaceae bacterium NML201209]